jgi:hypothetical protein
MTIGTISGLLGLKLMEDLSKKNGKKIESKD